MKNIVFHCENTRDLREKYDVEESRTLVEVLEDSYYIDFIYEIMKRFS